MLARGTIRSREFAIRIALGASRWRSVANARAGQPSGFDEALQLFASQAGFDFHYFHGCHDDVTLFELARAAFAIGRREEGEGLLARARAAGALEPLEPLEAARPG